LSCSDGQFALVLLLMFPEMVTVVLPLRVFSWVRISVLFWADVFGLFGFGRSVVRAFWFWECRGGLRGEMLMSLGLFWGSDLGFGGTA
jgi:hypothetical protein